MRILALASSEFGGDWHPLASLLTGLASRGHEIHITADEEIKKCAQTTRMSVNVLALRPEFSHFLSRFNGSANPLSEIELFNAWAESLIEPTAQLTQSLQPDLLICSLMKLPIAVRLKDKFQMSLCLLNPGVPLDAHDKSRFKQDFPQAEFRGVIRFWNALSESADLVLHATDPVFDALPDNLPSHHQYVGPLFWELPGDVPPYFEAPGDRWVLIAFSTAATHREIPFIKAALRVLAAMPVRALATVNVPERIKDFDVPPNAHLERYLPHSRVLRGGELVINHAGHGIVMKSLYFGVPMVLLPRSADQFANAARAQALGAAEVLLRDDMTDELLGALIEQVLDDPTYTRNAQQIADTLRERDSLSEACSWIETMN